MTEQESKRLAQDCIEVLRLQRDALGLDQTEHQLLRQCENTLIEVCRILMPMVNNELKKDDGGRKAKEIVKAALEIVATTIRVALQDASEYGWTEKSP